MVLFRITVDNFVPTCVSRVGLTCSRNCFAVYIVQLSHTGIHRHQFRMASAKLCMCSNLLISALEISEPSGIES